jgi:hypothetical protein
MDLMQPLLSPDWPAPARVRALMTTRAFGDVSTAGSREKLEGLLPAHAAWLHQVHGTRVVEAAGAGGRPRADASVARAAGSVCVVMAADCMPVLLTDVSGSVVAAAHAGWRGLCAGVIESTLDAMKAEPSRVLAWLGPAIGPERYEVGDEVRAAFVANDAAAASAFRPSQRPGHWMLDLYRVARQRLEARGVARIHGGSFCTHSDSGRFFSFRRDRTAERMAAAVWLA